MTTGQTAKRPDGRDMVFNIDGMTMNAWEAVVYYCDQLKNDGFRLADNYSDNFAVRNENSPENIWVIFMDRDLYYNEQQNIFRSWHYRHAAAYGFTGENGSCATLKAVEVFGYGTDVEDSRFDLNYWAGEVTDYDDIPVEDRLGNILCYYPLEVELDLSGSPYVETAGARMKKYEVDKNATKDGKLMDNDIVLFRFADVLLMRAEAKFRNGENGQDDYNASAIASRCLCVKSVSRTCSTNVCWNSAGRAGGVRISSASGNTRVSLRVTSGMPKWMRAMVIQPYSRYLLIS